MHIDDRELQGMKFQAPFDWFGMKRTLSGRSLFLWQGDGRGEKFLADAKKSFDKIRESAAEIGK